MNKIVDAINHASTSTKVIADVGAAGIAWGAIFTSVVPKIAAILSVIWLSMQIYTWIVNKRWKKDESNS